MAALFHTHTQTPAFGTAVPAGCGVRVRGREASQASWLPTVSEPRMYARKNAGDVPALVARCLR
jgi:hypothetical protein